MTDASERIEVTGAALHALAPEAGALSVYLRLIEAFARARVSWCYWKSSRRAAEALAGETDLDILVARRSLHEARRVLLECGFRLFVPVPARAAVLVECYLGYDEPSGRLAHVDLHARLTLGVALLKTHWLPWEESLIQRAAPRAGLSLPLLDPVSEAVLLVVRASLELRRFDPIAARNWSALTAKFALDRALLVSRVDAQAVQLRATQLLGASLAAPLATALFDPRTLQQQRALRQVREAVAHWRIYGGGEALLRTLWRGLRLAADTLNRRTLHWPRPWNRSVAGGGVLVAVIAVDGAGKSTLVRGLCGWLGREVDVLPLYFGTGDGRASWFLVPAKALIPLVSRLFARRPAGASHGVVTAHAPDRVYSWLLAIWATLVALEKRAKLHAARRAISRGMVVITDRYPQDEIPEFNDGPLLPRLRYVPQWLRTFEESAYALARERRPDVVIKLVASPDLIASREPGMDPSVIRARSAAIARLTLGGTPITAIAASEPAAAVLHAAKRAVWRAL